MRAAKAGDATKIEAALVAPSSSAYVNAAGFHVEGLMTT
jgi:hypothetical protein